MILTQLSKFVFLVGWPIGFIFYRFQLENQGLFTLMT